jgi:hypothetical protein
VTPQDRIVRTDRTTVVARHGVDIAVIDAGEVQGIAHEKADWDYRVEALALPILLSVRSSRAKSGGSTSNLVWWAVPLGVGLGLLNMLFGTVITTNLIYHYGVAGSATVTATSDSGSPSNGRPILDHSVPIRTPDRQVISTSFASDDFNVYPPHNRTTYPGKGEVFTVRYLSHFPRDFVIVSDDGSSWARWMQCRNLRIAVDDARQKRDFAPDQEEYRKAYDDAVRAEHDGGCDDDDGSE